MPPTVGSIKQSNTHWASLGQSEFDLPGTCATVGASRRRPDLPLVINIDAFLGRSDLIFGFKKHGRVKHPYLRPSPGMARQLLYIRVRKCRNPPPLDFVKSVV